MNGRVEMHLLMMGLHRNSFAIMASNGCGTLRAELISAKEEDNMTLGLGNAADHHLRLDLVHDHYFGM